MIVRSLAGRSRHADTCLQNSASGMLIFLKNCSIERLGTTELRKYSGRSKRASADCSNSGRFMLRYLVAAPNTSSQKDRGVSPMRSVNRDCRSTKSALDAREVFFAVSSNIVKDRAISIGYSSWET